MKYYYYTAWKSEVEEGVIHHSTWVTEERPREFFSNLMDNVIEIHVFETEEEMKAFWDRKQLRPRFEEIYELVSND